MSIVTAPKSDAHIAVNPANNTAIDPAIDPEITPTHNPAPIASTAASRRDDLGPVILPLVALAAPLDEWDRDPAHLRDHQGCWRTLPSLHRRASSPRMSVTPHL